MNKATSSLFLTLLFSFNVTHAGKGMMSKVYCSIFGNQDVSPAYKEIAQQALKQLGVKDFESVSVKQMNGVGPAFARMDLSSFTAFGIWLDEDYLDTCTEEEKLFHIYHEASHYVSMHHQKILAGAALSLPLITWGLAKLSSASTGSFFTACAMFTGLSAVALAGIYFGVLPRVVKRQEKQADLLAAQILMDMGREDVVIDHINSLKASRNQDSSDTWWYSVKDQIKYLENLSPTIPVIVSG